MTGRDRLVLMQEDEVPARADDLVARDAVAGQAAAAIGCLTVGLGLVGFAVGAGVHGGYVVAVMFGLGGAVVVLVGLAFRSAWRAARLPTNWRLRATPDGLYVKLRSFMNHRLPAEDPIVLFVPRRLVGWLRHHRQSMVTGGADQENRRHVRRSGLEVKLDGPLEEVEAELVRERNRWVPNRMGRSRNPHYPVSVQAGGIVRIDWHGPETSLRPRIAPALARLVTDHGYRVAPEASTDRSSVQDGARPEHEQQLLEHAMRGEMIEATRLARVLYGFDTTEARRYVDELAGRTATRKTSAAT